jgi:hypothetical protein
VNDDSNVHQGSSTHDFEIGAIDPVAPHDLLHYHTLTKQKEKWLGKLAPRLDIALHRCESAFDIICSIMTKRCCKVVGCYLSFQSAMLVGERSAVFVRTNCLHKVLVDGAVRVHVLQNRPFQRQVIVARCASRMLQGAEKRVVPDRSVTIFHGGKGRSRTGTGRLQGQDERSSEQSSETRGI